MAESFVQAAEDELSCPICFELFVDPNTPKNLPGCGHVCCKLCLEKMVAGEYARACPECRRVIRIPSTAMPSFPTNFRLRNLAEKHRKVSDAQALRSGLTATAPPQVIIRYDEHTKMTGVAICPAHEEEKMHYFCTTCNMLACQACLILKHGGTQHKIEGVKEKYNEQKVQMHAIIEHSSRSIYRAKDTIQRIKEREELIQNSQAAVEKQIDDRVELHVNELLSQSQDLMSTLQLAGQQELAELKQQLVYAEEEVQAAETIHEAAVHALENAPDYEYITQHVSLADELKTLNFEEKMSRVSVPTNDVAEFIEGKTTIDLGSIKIPHQSMKMLHKTSINLGSTDVTPNKRTRLQTLGGFYIVRSIAYSSSGLVAVCDKTGSNVTVYHNVKGLYKKKRRVSLERSVKWEPTDVAFCSDGRVLVARYAGIEVYTPDGEYEKTISIAKPGVPINACSVATTSGGRILVGDIARSVILEFDLMGNIARTIETTTRPVYMTVIHDTHIATSDYQSDTVKVIDLTTGQETLSISIPNVYGICYDEETDCLLTARKERADEPGAVLLNTGVIEQYSYTTGKFVARFLDRLCSPAGLMLTPERHLFVANMKTVKIYHIY